MSLTSKSTLSLKKKDVQQQKKAGTAYRRLVFAHKASAGETGVTFTALVQPSEMATLGFTNPSSADILAANILFYKKNLTVISSARGVLMQDLSYTVPTSSRIEFQGFTSLENEIFTFLLETGVKDGINVVDASPIVATGELSVGNTDFNVGTPFEVNKYSAQQIGAVLVFRNGVIQFRNPGNGTSGGNYQEVNNGSGLGTIIRFNSAPVSQPDNIVVWGHHLAERPDGSMMAAIESLAGQVDTMIPTLAALAGVPETAFQAAPNNQDLKAFGDLVHSILDVQVPIVTDWQEYVPTFNSGFTVGTGGYSKWYWRRVGDNCEIRGSFKLGTSGFSMGSGNFTFSLPAELQLNENKLAGSGDGVNGSNYARVGNVSIYDAYGTSDREVYIAVRNAASLNSFYITGRTDTGISAQVSSTFPFTWGAEDSLAVYGFSVPIAGWSTTQTLRQQLGL